MDKVTDPSEFSEVPQLSECSTYDIPASLAARFRATTCKRPADVSAPHRQAKRPAFAVPEDEVLAVPCELTNQKYDNFCPAPL